MTVCDLKLPAQERQALARDSIDLISLTEIKYCSRANDEQHTKLQMLLDVWPFGNNMRSPLPDSAGWNKIFHILLIVDVACNGG